MVNIEKSVWSRFKWKMMDTTSKQCSPCSEMNFAYRGMMFRGLAHKISELFSTFTLREYIYQTGTSIHQGDKQCKSFALKIFCHSILRNFNSGPINNYKSNYHETHCNNAVRYVVLALWAIQFSLR